jgi:Fur family transcriptional regulator, ferric uptake regulator
MSHEQLHWEYVLNRAGHRVTRQRQVVIDAVCAGQGHTTFDDIYARVRRADRAVDRSTVYRALRLFVAVGLVVEAHTPGSETMYEVRRSAPHHHLVCQRCGAEWEISADLLQPLDDAVWSAHRFHVGTEHLVLTGCCEACARAGTGKPRKAAAHRS